MFSLTKDSNLQEIRFYIYDFLNKYGFNDGSYILKDEEEIVQSLCQEIVKVFGIIDKRWEPSIISSGHNPFYVAFVDRATGEVLSYYEMEEKDRRSIELKIQELFY